MCRRCFSFPTKNFFHQRYSRQKNVERVSSGNDSLATRWLQQLTVLPLYIKQKLHGIMSSACQLIFRLSPGSPTANYIKDLRWLPMKQRILYKILLFGHRLLHHPWKIPMYLGALVFRNDKVTRCQYAYNLKVPNVTTAFGRRSFSFAVPFEWKSCLLRWNYCLINLIIAKNWKLLFNIWFWKHFWVYKWWINL